MAVAKGKLETLLTADVDPFATKFKAVIQSSPEIAVEQGCFHAVLRAIP